MALASDQIVRLTVKQALAGEEIVNVYFYQSQELVGAVSYEDVWADLKPILVDAVTPNQHVALQYTSVLMENMTNGIDLVEIPLTDTGELDTGEFLPTLNAFAIRFNRTSRVTRNGYKRYAGATEDKVFGNVWTAPFLASLDVLAGLLDNPIAVEGDDGSVGMFPVIVGRDASGSLDLSRVQSFVGQAIPTVRSQVSRRP